MVTGSRCILLAAVIISAPAIGWSQNASGTPVGAVSPSSLTFSALEVGRNTPSRTLTVTNSGDGQLRVTGTTLAGPAASDFSVFNGCRFPLSKNQRCVISVGFKPSSAGVRESTLNIATSDKELSVKLTGSLSSTSPKIAMSPTTLSLGAINVGSTSAVQKITLTNTGNADFSLGAVRASGADTIDFQVKSTCESKVAAGKACDITVVFAPKSPGEKTAAITIAGEAIGSPTTTKLSGTGVGSKLNVSTPRLAYAEQATATQSTPQSVTLSNGGNATLSFSKISLTGPNATDFNQSNNCNSNLAPGANCTVTVTYKPTVEGPKIASVAISGNFGAAPALIALFADGKRPMQGGLWRGKDPLSGKGILALIAENGGSQYLREDGVQYFGPTLINGEKLEAVLSVASAETLQGSARISGTIKQSTSIAAKLTFIPKSGSTQSGDLSLSFDALYKKTSSLDKIAGNFRISSGATMNISASGVIFSQDATTGCVINGAASMIDSRFNAYGLRLSFTSCKGSLANLNTTTALGLATLDDSGTTPRIVMAAQTLRPGYAVSITADRQ